MSHLLDQKNRLALSLPLPLLSPPTLMRTRSRPPRNPINRRTNGGAKQPVAKRVLRRRSSRGVVRKIMLHNESDEDSYLQVRTKK